jgi:hypothetical protein
MIFRNKKKYNTVWTTVMLFHLVTGQFLNIKELLNFDIAKKKNKIICSPN